MTFSWKFLLELMFVNILVVGLETLIWREQGYDAATVLPIFGVINWVLAIGLVFLWARMLGHGTPRTAGKRATLTQELGAIYYEGAGSPGA